MKRAGAIALTLLALAAPSAAAQEAEPQAPEPQASLAEIESKVMCVVCGVPLEHATEAPQAIEERQFIRELIAQGLTEDQILDRLVDEFGSEVLAMPDTSGFDLAAWLVPGLGIVLAGGAIFVGLRRWRRASRDDDDEHGDDGPGGPASPTNGAVSAEDAARLEQDLARYDL